MATETQSLVEAAKADLMELLSVPYSEKVEVFVHVHGLQIEPPHAKGSQCYTIQPSGENKMAYLRRGCTLPAQLKAAAVAGSGEALSEFVGPFVTAGGSEQLVLILWGHAQGVADAIRGGRPARHRPAASNQARPLTYAGISNTDLAERLGGILKGKKLPLLVFDSCLMGAVEVVAEFKDVAEYLVASQRTVDLPALQLASVIEAAHEVDTALALGQRIAAQAATTTTGVDSLTLFRPAADMRAFGKLADALNQGVRVPHVARQVFRAFRRTRFREIRQFLDLVSLARRLSRPSIHAPERDIAKAAKALAERLQPAPDGFVVKLSERQQKSPYGGVSVYCPWFAASHAELDKGVGDALVDDGDYLAHQLVEPKNDAPSWGTLMLSLRPAFEIGRELGAADCAPACRCSCCGDSHTHGPQATEVAVRAGGPKEPRLSIRVLR